MRGGGGGGGGEGGGNWWSCVWYLENDKYGTMEERERQHSLGQWRHRIESGAHQEDRIRRLDVLKRTFEPLDAGRVES